MEFKEITQEYDSILGSIICPNIISVSLPPMSSDDLLKAIINDATIPPSNNPFSITTFSFSLGFNEQINRINIPYNPYVDKRSK